QSEVLRVCRLQANEAARRYSDNRQRLVAIDDLLANDRPVGIEPSLPVGPTHHRYVARRARAAVFLADQTAKRGIHAQDRKIIRSYKPAAHDLRLQAVTV